MKKLFALILAACMLLSGAALAENWTCQQCGALNEHNFCGDCGAKKSDEWTCSGCGAKNKSKFCPDCGMSRDNNSPAKPEETAAPTVPAAAQLKVTPRVSFHRLDDTSTIYESYDNVVYVGDYDEEINYCLGCLVDNLTGEEQVAKLTAEVAGETYTFNDRAIAGNDDHGFMITSLKLELGTYHIKWFQDGVLAAETTVTVKEGNSETYEWIKANIDTSVGLSIWDTVNEKRVENGLAIGEISKLGSNQKYIPHLTVTNKSSIISPALFVCFYLDDNTWWWEDQYVEAGETFNYIHTSYEHKIGASELLMYINGIRVDRTMFAIFE